MLRSVVLLASFAQDPTPATPQEAASRKDAAAAVDAILPPPKELDDATAKKALASLWKPQEKLTLAQKVERIETLRDVQHKSFVKPLTALVQNETQLTVRKAAALALSRQPAASARPALLALLKDERMAPEVLAVVVEGLAGAGYQSADWTSVAPHFEKDFLPARYALQKQVIKLAARHKEKQAVKLLLHHIDEPIPDNVDAASNPPAEYWEKRYKAWQAWREDVKDAVFQITGQSFSTRKEARAWLKVNGPKLGITDF